MADPIVVPRPIPYPIDPVVGPIVQPYDPVDGDGGGEDAGECAERCLETYNEARKSCAALYGTGGIFEGAEEENGKSALVTCMLAANDEYTTCLMKCGFVCIPKNSGES
jgi:hypothetical protein